MEVEFRVRVWAEGASEGCAWLEQVIVAKTAAWDTPQRLPHATSLWPLPWIVLEHADSVPHKALTTSLGFLTMWANSSPKGRCDPEVCLWWEIDVFKVLVEASFQHSAQ